MGNNKITTSDLCHFSHHFSTLHHIHRHKDKSAHLRQRSNWTIFQNTAKNSFCMYHGHVVRNVRQVLAIHRRKYDPTCIHIDLERRIKNRVHECHSKIFRWKPFNIILFYFAYPVAFTSHTVQRQALKKTIPTINVNFLYCKFKDVTAVYHFRPRMSGLVQTRYAEGSFECKSPRFVS